MKRWDLIGSRTITGWWRARAANQTDPDSVQLPWAHLQMAHEGRLRTFHDLRHSAATFLLAQGFTLEDVKNLLRHSSIVLTSKTCGHVLEERQRQVATGLDAVLGG